MSSNTINPERLQEVLARSLESGSHADWERDSEAGTPYVGEGGTTDFHPIPSSQDDVRSREFTIERWWEHHYGERVTDAFIVKVREAERARIVAIIRSQAGHDAGWEGGNKAIANLIGNTQGEILS